MKSRAEAASGAPLQGLRVAVTRSPDRSAALVRALRGAGADPVLVPLIDFETAPDQAALTAALDALAAGQYGWLVVSSITTVRALKQWCATHGTSLPELVPAATRIATIGPSSRRVLEAEGLRVELAPAAVQSAAGLVELWPAGDARVLLPQSNLAESTLASGLSAKGADVHPVTAYETVDYPARPQARLTAVLAPGDAWNSRAGSAAPAELPEPDRLSPDRARAAIRAGAIAAVVAASGSAARSIARQLGPLPESCLLIAIGAPTREESLRVGLRVAATAKEPSPSGIVEALTEALHAAGAHPGVPATVPPKEIL